MTGSAGIRCGALVQSAPRRMSAVTIGSDEPNRLPGDCRHHAFRRSSARCAVSCAKRSRSVAWLLALFLAWHFSDLIAPHLGGLLSDSDVRPWAARVIIVVLVLLLGAAVGATLATSCGCRSSAAWTACSASPSACCAASCCSGCSSFSASCCGCRSEHWWRQSLLIPYGESIANGLRTLVGEERVRHAASAERV